MAELGKRVLFLEKGHLVEPGSAPDDALLVDPAARLQAGHWPDRFDASIDDGKMSLYAALGCGVGGSTRIRSCAPSPANCARCRAWRASMTPARSRRATR